MSSTCCVCMQLYSIIQNACSWTEDIIFNLTQFHHNILKIASSMWHMSPTIYSLSPV